MKRVELEADQMPGQDSFLDVITNIVGILILLVLVAGLRSSQAVHGASSAQAIEQTSNEDQLRQAYMSAMTTETGIRDQISRLGNAREEASLLEEERFLLNTAVAGAEQEITARRAKLTSQEQRDFDMRRKLNDAQMKLDQLTREQIALLSREAPTEEIQCEPTPLGKVVTGKEVHILLADDYVAIVPFEELLDQMKTDVTANIYRLKDQDELERAIGPIQGFRLRYSFVKAEIVARSAAGATTAGSIPRFSHCTFLPVTKPAGEPADEALSPNSEFDQYLRRLRPETTVTIWTYPGNFDRLREVKRAVREFGLQVAVRPLPPGMPIGASRSGSESVSE